MNRKLILKLSLLGLVILGVSMLAFHGASADAPDCAVLASAYKASDCQAGQDYGTCTVLNRSDDYPNCGSGLNSDQLKAAFISNLSWYASSGQPFERVGAAWIEAKLGSDWQARVDLSSVTLRVQNFSYALNTAYDPTTNSIIQYSDPGMDLSLVFYANDVEEFAIKLNCGNPVGYLNELPGPNITISGLVYYYDGTGSTGLDGVSVTTCNTPATLETSGGGSFSFTPATNSGFCIRVPSTVTIGGNVYSNLKITPDYIENGPPPGGSPPPGEVGSCDGNTTSYEEQIANYPTSPGKCDYGVSDGGYNISYNSCVNSSNQPCGGGTSPSNCGQSGAEAGYISEYSSVPIKLNSLVPSNSSPNPAPSTVTNSGGNPGPWLQAYSEGYQINDAHDQYHNFSGPTYLSGLPTAEQTSANFTLNYQNYITAWPYDDHSTTVDYQQQLYEAYWTASFSHYVCNGGDTLSGSTCYSYTSCTPNSSPPPDCSGCPSGYPDGPNSSDQCWYTYGASSVWDYNWQWTKNSVWLSSTQQATALAELCPRNFELYPNRQETSDPTLYTDINQVSLNTIASQPDTPDSYTVSSRAAVKFTLDYWGDGEVRNVFSVDGLQYTGDYYLEPANGTPSLLNSETRSFNESDGYKSVGNTYSNYTTPSNPVTMNVGDQVCAQITDSPQQGQVDEDGNIQTYSGQVQSPDINSSSSSSTPWICSAAMENLPYARSYGNDMVAGTEFDDTSTSCPANPSNPPTLDGNTDTNDTFGDGGSGDQFAAMALGQIQNFASAFLRSSTEGAPNSYSGLTIDNSGAVFGSDCFPIYNYYLYKPTNLTANTSNTFTIPPNGGTFFYQPSRGYVTINGGTVGGNTVLYVNGNVYIPGNINISNNASFNYDTVNNPITNPPGSLYIIAQGNIYIDSSVTHLDGVYVAENDCDASIHCSNVGGLINTCSENVSYNLSGNDSDGFPVNSLFSQCTNQLVISGALIGDAVKMERTFASMRNTQSFENPFGGGMQDCSNGNGGTAGSSSYGCASEVFDFNPIQYLGNPGLSTGQRYNYDSIVSLPPVL